MREIAKRVYRRGAGTVELPFLMSCALFLLDRSFTLLGVRRRVGKVRFDLVVGITSIPGFLGLAEAKYRSDGRPVRPYEVKRFAKEVASAKEALKDAHVQAFFLTNTKLSQQAAAEARKHRIRTFKVPLLFQLHAGKMERKEEKGGKRQSDERTTSPKL